MPKKPKPKTEATGKPSDLAKVVTEIIKALEPLSKEQQQRVMDAVAKMLFSTPATNFTPPSKPPRQALDEILKAVTPQYTFTSTAPRTVALM